MSEVVVRRRLAEQRVAYRAADTPGFEAAVLEPAGDLGDFDGEWEGWLGTTRPDARRRSSAVRAPADNAIKSSIRAWDGVRGPARDRAHLDQPRAAAVEA